MLPGQAPTLQTSRGPPRPPPSIKHLLVCPLFIFFLTLPATQGGRHCMPIRQVGTQRKKPAPRVAQPEETPLGGIRLQSRPPAEPGKGESPGLSGDWEGIPGPPAPKVRAASRAGNPARAPKRGAAAGKSGEKLLLFFFFFSGTLPPRPPPGSRPHVGRPCAAPRRRPIAFVGSSQARRRPQRTRPVFFSL